MCYMNTMFTLRRYFTWDSNKFPSPVDMINELATKGRKVYNNMFIWCPLHIIYEETCVYHK